MYLSMSKHAVSAAEGSRCTTGNILCQQDFGQCRDKIFAPGEVGVSTGTCYKEFPHYFQAHIVYVLTEYPLQSLLKRVVLNLGAREVKVYSDSRLVVN